ncbi:MAG: hypothetical protein AMDU3_IPLC00001G0239 [Thermoplasmatales archaeon I-plasma]|jgi:hypothetical protein|nr:MAG: hypothetical protein AMDU3_IPLC00001G0239 [Thermoplasmatales archaeon I-plasma]
MTLYIFTFSHIVRGSNVAILGGGWAGLLVAKRLIENGIENISILEATKEGDQGGLLRSEVINGFTFDCGGPHLLFSRDREILSRINELLGDNVSERIRNNFVFYRGEHIQYPFENGIYLLPPEKRVLFLEGIFKSMIFTAKNVNWKPENFLEWITGFFGDHLSKEYLIPYNEKVWKRPLDSMAADWVFTPGRLPFPSLSNMLKSAAGLPTTGYKEQAHFYYPKIGGISALFSSLYKKVIDSGVRYVNGVRVSSVRKGNEGDFVINGRILSKRVVSTIPLPELLLSLDSKNYSKLADRFDYNSVAIVGVAIKGKTPDKTTIYVPDPKVIFHRYTWMSSLVPPNNSGRSNLIAEMTLPKGENFDPERIRDEVIRGLVDMGVIDDENSILFTRLWFNKYGYPIYTMDHNAVRGEAISVLGDYGIKSVGRWGSWHYWNTDMVYKAVEDTLR